MRTLSNFRDETSNAANLAALKPTDDDTMMRIVMGGNRIQEIDGKKRLVPGERLTYGGLSDSDFTKKMLSADANTVQTALADIRSRPVDVSYALLEHRNPSVRASVADALAVRSVSNRVAILRLLSDPVAEVRLTATKFLVPEQFGKDRQVFLRMMAESDPDIAVRARARSNLVSISSAIPGVSYHQPRALLQSKFVADLRQELGNVALREDHFLPIAIAKHVYTLPEYEQAGVKTGRELVDRLYNAEATTPPGYRLAGGMGDLRTGFKGGIYLPEALGSTDPTIIAIAGSQTLSDWLVDGGMGRMQARGRFYSDLLERTIKEFKNTNNPIVITGHSLGGGMAQMFGHDLVKELEAQGFKNALDRVKVVSFNGFGATEPLREMGRLDERIAKNLDVTFYHVNGDPVSAIGTPLGSPSKRFEVNQSEYKAFWNIHIMAGVDAALLKVGGLSTTKLQEASIAAALSHASGPLGNVTESVQAARYWWKKDAWLSQLADASKILAGERGWAHINPEFEWFKTEMNIAVDRFAGAEKADRSLILADVDKFRANVNATLQVPASEPLPRFLEQRLSSEELLAMGRKEEATQVKEVATDIMKQNVLGTAPKPGPPRHLQPEIWNSLETKMPGAEQRVKDTENALRTMKIVNFEDVGIGLSQPKRLTFEDGTQGLWKPYEAYFNNRPDSFRTANGNSELAAYAVDRFLGLNLVPITVERDFEGQRGTVQLWVSNSRMGTTASAKELNLFDHLINEPDRNGVNFLYAPSRLKPIAIDHGGAFGNGNPEDLAKLGRPEFAVDVQKVLDGLKDGSLTRELALNQVKGLIDPDVIERLRASTADDWKKTLGGLLTENQIDQLLLRRDKIVSLSEELEAQLGKSIFTANPDVPDLRHSLVTVSPREAHLTESYIGLAQVRETLDELGRNSSGFKDLRNGARKMAEREIPAVKGPDLWTQSKEARVYLLDGHHEDTALYQLRFGAYDDLPKSVRNVISADDQRELAADSKLDLRVNVEKTYATREEMTTDFAKRGIGLFSEASEKQYAALLAKARAGDELTGAEQARLVAAYQTIPKNVPKLTDDPSAAAIAKVFRDANIDSDLRDYARYQIQKGINGEAIKALGITTENALTPKVQEGLKHLMLDNPDGLRELRGLTKKGKDKDGFAYKSRTDAAIDQAVAARKSSLEYKMTNVIGDGMRLDAEPKIRGKIEVPTKEESQARLDAAAQLWHEGRPDDAFRAKIAAVGKTGAIDPSFAPELKNVRDRLKLYRFLCHAVCKDTESLGQLDTLTAAMGHLTDAGKFGDKAKIKAEAKILADYLTPSYLKGVDKEITSMRALGRHDLGDQIDEMVAHMRKTMGKSELTEKQFHETRKDLGRLQTLVLLDALDGKRPVANSSSYQAMRKVYESLGAEHDKIVETIFKDPANLAAIHFTPEQTQGLDRVLRYFEPGSDSVRHSLVGALPTKLQEVKSLLKDPAALEARSASNLALKREKLGKLSADEEALIDKVKSLPFRVEHRSVEADAASKSEEGLLPLSQAPGGKAQVTSFEDKVYGANDFVYATGSSTGWAGQEHYGKAVFEVKPEFWKQNSWASSSEWWREARAKINYKNVDKNIDKLDLTKTRENFAKDLFVPKDYGEQIALETVKALRENPALSIKKFLAEDAEGLKKLMYQNHLGYLEIKLPPVPADQLVSLSEKAVVRAKVDMAEERAVLKTRADRVLREQGETQARAELSSAAAKEIHQRNDRILELEAQMAKLMQNRELAQVPKRYVYEMKGAEKAPLAPALAATTEQKDTLLRQYPQTHLLYDPVLNNYAGSGALTNSGANSISVGYFSQLLSNKEMDVFLEHEGLHLSLSKKNEKGIPTAFDAYFQSNGKKKLGKPPYTTSLYKQEEATHRMQTKLTLRYAEDAAAVREIYGEKAVPANLLRELSSQGINLDKISSDGKIKGGFTALDNYRELTAGSLSQLEEVKKALDAKGAKAYTLGVSETGLPMAKFVNKGKDGQFETSAEIYLAKEVPNMKKGKWVPSPRLAHQEIEEQVERMTSASRMLHAEAEKLAAELAPGPDAGKIVQSTAAKTKMTAQETAQLEKLTEEHAKEVQKVMELLGHKDGSVVMLKKGEETKGLEAHKFEEPRHSLVSGREPASMVETPHPHESDLTAHLDMEHPETQEMKLREVDRDLMSTLRDNKEKKEFSYVVDEENRIHAVEGRLKFGEGHLRIANVREGNALKSFLVKESGQILYDTKAKKYTFKADYGLDLSKAEHDATLADLKKKIPPEMLAKPDAGDDYAKVLDCTSQLEEQLSGKGDALTRVIMRNVSSTGMEGLKQLDLMYRYSDDPEELHARERKLWTSFFVDIPRRTGGAWTSSLVGKPLISYNVNPYAAFGARYANGAAINYA
ncbi:MAG: lipase family protein, partial [Bdellovibrionota bacterium]